MSVPEPRTRFVGRTSDLDDLAALCSSEARRVLVTLWGPPGIGKTRLALELCKRAARAWFCDLSTARDADDVADVVGSALGSSRAGVGAALAAAEPGVVVLDNFEQVAEHAAVTVGRWLEVAPHVRFVVTSRERLRLDGEITREVTPLHEALELFLDRMDPRHAVDPGAAASLVARLEGIPLAIELAAARASVLGVEDLLARLDHPLDALGQGGILERAIASSLRALPPGLHAVLVGCAVFRGSFTVDDVEAVLAPLPGASVIDGLQRLRDRSLVRCLGGDAATRFQLFETIRAHVAPGLDDETRRRHANHTLSRAGADAANLADAVAWTLDDEGTSPARLGEAIRALARLEPGRLTDSLLELLGRALATGEGCDRGWLARGHRARGRALVLRGRTAQARAELERARSLAGDDHALAAEVWADLGVLHHQLREMDEAREHYETSLALGDDPVLRGRTIGNLGALEHDLRRFDVAVERYEEAIAVFWAMGNPGLEGTFLANLAVLLQETGASKRARATYLLALERLHPHDVRLEAITRSNLGLLHHELGELDEARACHEGALELFRVVTDARSEGLCLGRLAMVLGAMGHHQEARARCHRAERLLRGAADRMSLEVLELFRAYIDVAASADTVLTRERLTRARSLSAHCDDARTTVRLIEAALAKGSEARVLVVGADARWLTPPGGKTLDLGSRHVLRRLLWRLVENHRAFPGEGLTLDELREAGWPSDRVLAPEAQNRVHVALTELRRRGLRTCLQRTGGRYMIDPGVRVEIQ